MPAFACSYGKAVLSGRGLPLIVARRVLVIARCATRYSLFSALVVGQHTWAGQEALTENPAPATPQRVTTPLEQSFPKTPSPETTAFVEWADHAHQSPFLRDTQLTLKPRIYYFDQDLPGGNGAKAWAGGGSLAYVSGWLAERVRVGAEGFTSQPIYAPDDRDGTVLLAPRQQGYTVLGQAYGQVKIVDDHVLTAGRSEYDTPYANRFFNRMTPNTFQGVSLKGSFPNIRENGSTDYLVGYLSDIKLRNSEQFIPMSQALGRADRYYGTTLAEIKYAIQNVSAGIAEYYTPQNLNILYTELNWAPQWGSEYGLKLSAQHTNEQSVGSALSLNDNLAHANTGVRASFGESGFVFAVAYSCTSSDGNLINPWGGNPSYTQGLVRNRNRAGEQGGLGSVSYDFATLDLAGLSASAIYAYGWSAINPSTGTAISDTHELDLTLDYRVQKSMLKGLWLRIQRLFVQAAGEPEANNEWRIILNWEIPLI